jgi:hypothetical protein
MRGVDFIRQFDQAHEQAKSVFAAQKELLDTLEQINEHWFARVKFHARYEQRLSGLVGSAHAAIRRG